MAPKPATMNPNRAIIGRIGWALLIVGLIAFFLWFALSGPPDLWVVLNGLLQPR